MNYKLKHPVSIVVLSILALVLLNPLQMAGAAPAAQTASAIRVNQTGYLPNLAKFATIVSSATSPMTWQLKNSGGTVVASGSTTVFGSDTTSGESVHQVDFSSFNVEGTGYTLTAGGASSYPFDIRANIYTQLKYDALAYFYHNRSGIAIAMPYAGGSQWTRPAGHIGVYPNTGDISVTCGGTPSYSCAYSLNVSKGWYDAGDHGKYVVNGGISVWTMMNQYERSKYLGSNLTQFADGHMNIPESANGVPDILDEARWEMEFILGMQVPTGYTYAGMVHHKMHDDGWTGLPTRPDQDSKQRVLRPVSTAATLNLAATAAQCARIWATIDTTFSNRCLTAAQSAWTAANANPNMIADGNDNGGGGSYGDGTVSDDFYWAAAELYVTTGSSTYYNYITGATSYYKVIPSNNPMTWDNTSTLGNISLAVAPNNLATADKNAIKTNIQTAANSYLTTINAQGYRLPMATYDWGSNSFVLNSAIIMALAYDFSGSASYLNGVGNAMDYIMGRNAMNKSYISGYGENPLNNPHHRFWAHQKNASYPSAPPGAVSGGPNPGLQDPIVGPLDPNQTGQKLLVTNNAPNCAPQKCYLDDIDAWSVNEITVNWNAPLAWVTAFLDEKAVPGPTPTPTNTPIACATTDIAQGKTATSSSNESATYSADKAVDGSGTTRWASLFADPQWLQVDLGATYSLCSVQLNWEAAYGKDYQIQISSDATNWTSVKTITNNNALTNVWNITGSARYVRMYGTARGTTYGYSLFDFKIYPVSGPTLTPSNTPLPPTATNTPLPATATNTPLPATATNTPGACGSTDTAQGKTATSSSNENASYTPNLAVDGNTTTRWSSVAADPQWLQVDLGATYTICRVGLNWEAAYGKDYLVQVSSDGTNWTTIKTVTNNTVLANDWTVSGSGRYVRMYGTARGTVYGYSLYDFKVFTTGAAGPTATSAPPTATFTSSPTPATGSCQVAYAITSDWGSGATVNVTITNNGASAVNGWTLAWNFPGNQGITSIWNATHTQTGTAVSATAGGTISANGGTTNFGFNINYSGSNQKPTSFTLNGANCSIAP